ncbi:DUF4185 domain-containing protein [Saccharopolyspora sp. HNM0983]|uniref:DUF4185 domain-containing protein n=1 Tax=Saccharopolyspora montiporae TaxID=2781240 RepID=A0A929BEK7_9PSEU|nr:DUF4185 domain-containing protein [Saccharopolyspora sp. HNM0983]
MHKVTDLTGPGLTERFGIGGTDLGAVATAPDGRLVAVFGDTFERAGIGGPGWRSPVVLFADPSGIGSGLRWTGAAGRGDYAEQILPYQHDTVIHGKHVSTVIPTDLITVGGAMFLHVMVCAGIGNVHWTEVHRSTDNGQSWQHTGTTWPGDHLGGLFQMLTWELGDDGMVYAFSTGFQRDRGLLLQRVPADRLTDPNAWEGWGFRDGAWAWGNPPTIVLTGAYGELSLRRVADRWLLACFDAGNYRMDVRDLNGPTDNLYEARLSTALQGTSWRGEDHRAGGVAQLYGGYIVPGSSIDELHLVVSQWNTQKNWPYRAMQFTGPAPGSTAAPAAPPAAAQTGGEPGGVRGVLRRFLGGGDR